MAVGVLAGTAAGVVMGLLSYLLAIGDRSNFGVVMFCAIPFVSGFITAAIVRCPKRIAASCALGGVFMFLILLGTGFEGIICCLMALPIVAATIALGAWIGYLTIGRRRDRMADASKTALLLFLLCPFFISAADRIEKPFRERKAQEVFSTRVFINAPPAKVWDEVARLEKLDGPKPFLLWAGLPVPYQCTLDREEVGGTRICHFNQGRIVQRVTDWNKPSKMSLKIEDSTLPGRHWLEFIDATYELRAKDGGTEITRHTTIGTRLYPRWYWRPFERWGVVSEHGFVFDNVKRTSEGH